MLPKDNDGEITTLGLAFTILTWTELVWTKLIRNEKDPVIIADSIKLHLAF